MKLRRCPRRETKVTSPFALDIINVPPVKETPHLNWNQWLVRSIRRAGTCLTRFFVPDGKSQRLLTVLNEHLRSFTLLWSRCDMKPAVLSVTVSVDGLEMWHSDNNKRKFPGCNYSASSTQMGSFVFFPNKTTCFIIFRISQEKFAASLCRTSTFIRVVGCCLTQKCNHSEMSTRWPLHLHSSPSESGLSAYTLHKNRNPRMPIRLSSSTFHPF